MNRLDRLVQAQANEREAQAVRELHKVADKLQGEGPVGRVDYGPDDLFAAPDVAHLDFPEGECEECDQVAGHLPFCGLAGGEV